MYRGYIIFLVATVIKLAFMVTRSLVWTHPYIIFTISNISIHQNTLTLTNKIL